MTRFHLVVAGNIGVGKSSFVERYAARRGARPVFEAVDGNPYLADFYADRPQWAFHSQVFFLMARLKQQGELARLDGDIVQDRSVYEDAEVFAENLFREKSLTRRDYETYRGLYDGVRAVVTPPDLVLYLKAGVPTLTDRIDRRGRTFEAKIPDEYLARLNELYDQFAAGFRDAPVVTIDTDYLDFVRDAAAFDEILRSIDTAR